MGAQATQITAVPAVRGTPTPVPQHVPPRSLRLPGVQARLTVGAVADPFEREADRMADHVMGVLRRMPLDSGHHDEAEGGETSRIQRRAVPSAHAASDDLSHVAASRISRSARALAPSITAAPDAHRCGPGCLQRHAAREHAVGESTLASRIRRSSGPGTPSISAAPSGHRCGPGCVQRHAGHDEAHDHPEIGAEGGDLGTELTARIRRSAGSGTAIDASVRGPMESAFGADFSNVRIHTDSDVAPRIGASAFTSGSDIHFASGEYKPADRSGQWLLSHELTHVVQQTGASPEGDVHRHTSGCIQRHASKEHYMLGSMTPEQIKSIADAKGKVESAAAATSGFMSLFTSTKRPPADQLKEALTSVQEQLVGLDNWKTAHILKPSPASIVKGDTTYHHEWGGQLVTVKCRDGELACTVGELNAIPDFFGSYEDLARVDRTVVFKTLQVIRRESYMYLKTLEGQLMGKSYTYDKKKEGFSGLQGNNISIAGNWGKTGDDVGDLLATESMLKGKGSEVGTDEGSSATATLGRNACHFPPESWLRWREYHEKARTLIESATSAQELGELANKAIGMNAFGEHYLQDSFAAGHLINKGFVMAVAMEHMSDATKWIRGVTDAHIVELQTATAHKEAYQLPQAAQEKVDASKIHGSVRKNAMDDKTIKARDPQSALDAAKAKKESGAGPGVIKGTEMLASGLDRFGMSFEQYRLFLNDFWLQKITNTLHDKYCINGLTVASPDNPKLFKIYGDNNMMRSSEGAAYTAATSLMSRGAINALVDNKRAALAAAKPGGVKPAAKKLDVPSVSAIIARFPNRVIDDDGTAMSLETWATGAPMRKKIAQVVHWRKGDTATGFVRLLSTGKQVSKGLTSDHGAF